MMSVANLMFNTCSVSRPTITADASGGQIKTYSVVATSAPCFVQPVSGHMAVYYNQRKIEVTDSVFFPSDQGLQTGDLLVFGTRSLYVQDYRNLCEKGVAWVAGCVEYR